MKRLILMLTMICTYFLVGGCVKEPPINMQNLDFVMENLNVNNVECAQYTRSMIDSRIWFFENESLINYIIKNIKEVNFIEEVADAYNREENVFGNRYIHFLLKNKKCIQFELTESGYFYLIYYELSDDDGYYKLTHCFKSDKSDKYSMFDSFVKSRYGNYYKDNVIDEYLNDPNLPLDDERYLAVRYIDYFAELALFYEEEVRFSASVIGFYGKYNNNYAVMMDGANITFEMEQTQETIAGVEFFYPSTNRIYIAFNSFFTLQEAYDLGIISYENLLEIKEKYENKKISYSETRNFDIIVNNVTCSLSKSAEVRVLEIIDSKNWQYLYDRSIGKCIEYNSSSNNFLISAFRTAGKSNFLLPSVGEEILLAYSVYEDGLVVMHLALFSTVIHDLYTYISTEELEEIISFFDL